MGSLGKEGHFNLISIPFLMIGVNLHRYVNSKGAAMLANSENGTGAPVPPVVVD